MLLLAVPAHSRRAIVLFFFLVVITQKRWMEAISFFGNSNSFFDCTVGIKKKKISFRPAGDRKSLLKVLVSNSILSRRKHTEKCVQFLSQKNEQDKKQHTPCCCCYCSTCGYCPVTVVASFWFFLVLINPINTDELTVVCFVVSVFF